jgi:hypothetical protein
MAASRPEEPASSDLHQSAYDGFDLAGFIMLDASPIVAVDEKAFLMQPKGAFV